MKFWTRFPLFRFLLPFSAGILSALYLELSLSYLCIGSTAGVAACLIFTIRNYASGKKAQRWLAGIPFYLTTWMLGALLLKTSETRNVTGHFSSVREASAFLVVVTEPSARTQKGTRIFCEVKAIKNDCVWLPARGKLVVYLRDTTHSLVPGYKKVLLISGKATPVKAPPNPGAFDYARFLSDKGIYHQLMVNPGQYYECQQTLHKDARTFAYDFRDELLNVLSKSISGSGELGVAGALLLGYEEWLDPETEQSYSNAGVLHVLCVSGMHVGLIYNILAWLLLWMEKRKWLRPFRYLFLTCLIWFYALVTGFSPSVIRAAAMLSLVIAGKFARRNASVYNLLCGSCFLMFIPDPFMIRSTGFVLSFLAVCGIVFYHRMFLPLWQPASRWAFSIWELVSVSLAAQLTTFPLCLFLFHQFPNYFMAGNLLIIPLSTIVMYSGLLILVTDWIPYAATCFGWVTSKGIQLLNFLVEYIGSLPGALTTGINITASETMLIYGLMILFTLWLVRKYFDWLLAVMVTMIIFLSIRLNVEMQAFNQKQLTVYHFRDQTIISIFQGPHAILFYSGDSTIAVKKTDLHRVQCNVDLKSVCRLQNGKFYQFKPSDQLCLIVATDWKTGTRPMMALPSSEKVLLLLSGKCTVKGSEIVQYVRPDCIIFDGSNRTYQVNRLMNDSCLHNVPTYFTGQRGAYTTDLLSHKSR